MKAKPIYAFIEQVRMRERKGMVVAEVGCFDGTTASYWLPIVKANMGSAILVDKFCGNPTVPEGNPHGEASYNIDEVRQRLGNILRCYNNITMLVGDSWKMAEEIGDQTLDICFLDADHRYSCFSLDLLAWMPKVKKGGLLCGHDFNGWDWDEKYVEIDQVDHQHHGVAKALSKFLPHARRIGDNCWAVDVQ